jgi:hypothetical protein
MLALNDDGTLTSRDRTRGSGYAAKITAHFVLDSADKQALSDIERVEGVEWWSLAKWEPKATEVTLHPEPQRHLVARGEWAEAVSHFADQARVDRMSGAIGQDIAPLVRAGLSALSAKSRTSLRRSSRRYTNLARRTK